MSYANFKMNVQKYAGINPDTRDMIVRGNLFVDGSANIAGLTPPDILPVSVTDIVGNVLSGSYATVSGNVKAGLFVGNGAFLENLQVEVPGNITADVVGNITGNTVVMSGNVTAGFLVGNASQLVGIVRSFPSTGNADIRGNVFAPGNVDTANMSTGNLAVNGNAFIFAANVAGNVITPLFFYGNGILLTNVTQTFPKTAEIDIIGNVFSPGNITANIIIANIANATTMFANVMLVTGNVTASYFLGSGTNMSNVVPSSLNTNILGNITASGNVYATYFSGNAMPVQLGGYTVVPRGDVANQAARLALTNAVAGSLVYQQDIAGSYILLGTPATVDSNWLRFTGANFPVTSVMGRTGNVVFISGTDVKTIGGANIAGSGSLTSANISIFGNARGVIMNSNTAIANVVSIGNLVETRMTVVGNVSANYLIGDGSLLEALQLTFPSSGSIDIQGNVVAPGNVDAENVSMVTANVGNITIFTLTSSGNVTGAWFVGNGLYITGIPATGTQPVNITGNVVATANVDAANSSTTVLNANTITVTGNVVVIGNVTALGFVGDGSRLFDLPASVSGTTQNVNIVGNVVATGNVDVGGNLTSNTALATTVIVSGQVNTIGNVTGWYLLGDGSRLTGTVASLGGTQNLDISGNVRSQGNISAANVTARIARTSEANVSGNLISIGNIVSSSFFIGSGSGLLNVTTVATGDQNVNIVGNVAASANVDASNVTTGILRVAGNVLVFGQTNSVGNIVAPFFLGNGLGLSNLVVSNAQFVNIIGNVTSGGNVNANNITTGIVRVNGSLVVTSQVNVTGNVVATGIVGDGSLLEGISFSSTASPTPSFVPPTTGFTADVANTILYSNTAGWTIQLQQYTPTNVGITTYSMPNNPDTPFVNLPSDVTQNLNVPWSFSNGVWSGNVRLRGNTLFSSRPSSMGYNSSYGILGGNSSATNSVGSRIPSINGAFRAFFSAPQMESDPFVFTTQNIWVTYIATSATTTVYGQTFTPGILYLLEFTVNFEYLVSFHPVTSGPTVVLPTSLGFIVIRWASETEAYLCLQPLTIGQGITIYDKTAVGPTVASVGYYFIARINPTDRTCSWITPISVRSATSSQRPYMSFNPQRSILFFSANFVGNGVSDVLTVGNLNGTAQSMLLVAGPTYHGAGMGLTTSTGIYISNTLFELSSGSAANTPYNPCASKDIWDASGQVAYMLIASYAALQFNLRTWVSASNTWTLQTSIVPQQTTYQGANPQAMVFRLPLGNTASVWQSTTVTTSPFPGSDAQGRIPLPVNLVAVPDGNVFFTASAIASNTSTSATFTLATASATIPINALYTPIVVFKFQDTNGSFSNYGAIVSTNTDNSYKYMGYNFSWTYSAGRVPGSNNSMRVIGTTNMTNATLAGTSCSNLTVAAQTFPFTFDITSALAVSNFRAQNTNVNSATSIADTLSGGMAFGPGNAYNLVVNRDFGIIKT